MLVKKFGFPVAHVDDMNAQMTERGVADGVEFQFDHTRPANTFDAQGSFISPARTTRQGP